MSTPIGEKIRNIREALNMGRQEFVDKTGIPKGTLIGIEQGNREPKAGILITIGNKWPQYSAYLLTEELSAKQVNPEYELYEKQRHCMPGIKKIENQEELIKEMEMNTIPRLKKKDLLPIKSKKNK